MILLHTSGVFPTLKYNTIPLKRDTQRDRKELHTFFQLGPDIECISEEYADKTYTSNMLIKSTTQQSQINQEGNFWFRSAALKGKLNITGSLADQPILRCMSDETPELKKRKKEGETRRCLKTLIALLLTHGVVVQLFNIDTVNYVNRSWRPILWERQNKT